ncbi:hypothetical protein GCM10009555_035030 [Acrocarpospora macrocephala]|uniref:Uncharacterized protein n=1 Tax=Acrocarpospora macrocephala TaxID=150177 RepID=A0A5M3WCX4_9ACTN|nr:hypothetical protein [Acrocarpospora macrocephala]GES06686.1 hypothetical protein Amac_002810 [Acrocarpospora macrocephala]
MNEEVGWLTDAELGLLRNLGDAGSPLPWRAMVEGRDHWSGDSFIMIGPEDRREDDMYVSREYGRTGTANLDLTAGARTALPRLLDEIVTRRARSSDSPAPAEPLVDSAEDFNDKEISEEVGWLTDAELELVRSLGDAGSPLPWRAMVEGRDHPEGGGSFIMIGPGDRHEAHMYVSRDYGPASTEDLDLIAASRTALPLLLDEIVTRRARS